MFTLRAGRGKRGWARTSVQVCDFSVCRVFVRIAVFRAGSRELLLVLFSPCSGESPRFWRWERNAASGVLLRDSWSSSCPCRAGALRSAGRSAPVPPWAVAPERVAAPAQTSPARRERASWRGRLGGVNFRPSLSSRRAAEGLGRSFPWVALLRRACAACLLRPEGNAASGVRLARAFSLILRFFEYPATHFEPPSWRQK